MSQLLASRLNLASRPFANQRPLVRVMTLLWTAAVALLVINGVLFWGYQSGSSEGRAELRSLRAEADAEVALVEALERRLGAFDLEAQNTQVEFLNQRILERTFPWSRLFDELVETMPREVRLSSLLPHSDDRRARRSRRRPRDVGGTDGGSWIVLEIQGEAATGEALLDFLQRLFEHPAFAEPSLLSEARQTPQLVTFNLQTRYRAQSATPPEPASEEPELGVAATTAASAELATEEGTEGETDGGAEEDTVAAVVADSAVAVGEAEGPR